MADAEDIPEPDRVGDAPHPRHTSALFGQKAAETAFLDAVAHGHMHHAWLLTGPSGVGKATLAWRIARYLIGQGPVAPVPPDLNMSPDNLTFRRVAALGEPRLFLCRRPWNDKTKKLSASITVDEVRKLKSFFTLSAADGGWRVAIVDAADDLNVSAANALLKILEEPPDNAAILLIAHQPGKLLPTIRSRCRTLALQHLCVGDLAQALSQIGMEPPANIEALHQITEGSVGQAVQFLGGDGAEIYAAITHVLSGGTRMDRPAILALAEACTGRGAEPRFTLTRHLIHLALARLAKSPVTPGGLPEATTGEARVHQQLAPNPAAAVIWANLAQELSARTAHAVAVNLDPSHVILDTFLQIEATAAKATA